MDTKDSYFSYLNDRRLGSKISSISLGFGFIGYVVKSQLTKESGTCHLMLPSEHNEALICYLALISPFFLGYVFGTLVLFRELRSAKYNESDIRSFFLRISFLTKMEHADNGEICNRDRKIIFYGAILLIMVSLVAIYFVVQPETYLEVSRNVFPIITLAILSMVYFELFMSMIIGALYQKLLTKTNREWRNK